MTSFKKTAYSKQLIYTKQLITISFPKTAYLYKTTYLCKTTCYDRNKLFFFINKLFLKKEIAISCFLKRGHNKLFCINKMF